MSIFNAFAKKEDLINAVSDAVLVRTNENGEIEYYIDNGSNDLKTRFDSEVKQSQNYRRRAQEAESKLKEQEQEIARLTASNEEFVKLNPEKQRETISNLINENGTLKAKKAELEKQLEPLRLKISDFEKKETRQKIEVELNNVAAELGIRAEAMRDVRLRANQLTINDVGLVSTPDGTLVKDFLKSELEQSPHWLPPSNGGGSNPGTFGGKVNDNAIYEQAKAKGDLDAMIGAAKPFCGLTHGNVASE
ncbi:MAG: hypothetical protein Q4C95_11430 [Planctomycetia bacterium]|nr:hypothetical protein [Planctomycetia bacterium]